jgi:hypothetical protein
MKLLLVVAPQRVPAHILFAALVTRPQVGVAATFAAVQRW